MSVLVEIELEYGSTLTEEQLAVLQERSLTKVEPGDGPGGLHWGAKPLLDAVDLALFPGAKIVRTVARANLTEFGQREATVINNKCQVAVAGLGLLTVDEVELRSDHCTDALQRDLDDGWRIIAICVQPDQRRPDYILGRTRAKAEP